MLLTKADDRTQSVLTVAQSGIYYQELMTADRPQSDRVKLGKLSLIDGEIMASFTEWDEFNLFTMERRTLERTLKVTLELILSHYKTLGIDSTESIGDEEVGKVLKELAKNWHPDKAKTEEQKTLFTEKMAEFNDCRDQLKALHKRYLDDSVSIDMIDQILSNHPIGKLTTLNGKIHERVNKLISSASFKNKWMQTAKGIKFMPLQTLEYFLEAQAKDLLKRHNDQLEAKGIDIGYLDIETARDIISNRYDRAMKRLELNAELNNLAQTAK